MNRTRKTTLLITMLLAALTLASGVGAGAKPDTGSYYWTERCHHDAASAGQSGRRCAAD